MRVLFLTHFFPPEIGAPQTRILETARDLRDRGHEVAVLTTFPNYPSGVIPPRYRGRYLMREKIDGIPVLRGWLHAVPNRGFGRRTLSHISFALSALPTATRLPWRPDVISVDMHPLFLCLTAAALGRVWRVPYVLNAGDLIPDQAVAYGVMSNPVLIRLSKAMANVVIGEATRIVPFTRGIQEALIQRGVPREKLDLIYYGADVAIFQSRDGCSTSLPQLDELREDAFVVTYAGTHGLPHGLEVVLEAARILQKTPEMQFVLAGDGGEKKRLTAQARRHNLTNVTFLDPLPRKKLPALYRRSDVCLVTLRRPDGPREFPPPLPSKVFDVMAAGRPVVVAAEGETAELVHRASAGVCVPPESPDELAAAIMALKSDAEQRRRMGENGRQYIVDHLSREQQSCRYESVFRRAVERPAHTTIDARTSFGRDGERP